MEKSLLCGGGNYVVVVDEVKVNIGPSILPHPLVDEAEYFLTITRLPPFHLEEEIFILT